MPARKAKKPVRNAIVYPRHAKSFAKPVRLSPLGRRQVGITQTVKRYVAGFQAKGLKGLELVRAIVNDVRNFEIVYLPMEKAKSQWGKRNINDIVSQKNVFAMIPEEAVKARTAAIMGCFDKSQAITASLRAVGLKAIFVRQAMHSNVKFLYKGEIYIADAANTKKESVRKMETSDKKLENKYRSANAFAEGISPAEIGLKDYSNFFKYKYRSNARR